MDHHQKGESSEAARLYKKFISNGGKDKRAYTNLAALLRGEEKSEEAMQIAKMGLKETGGKSPILLNTLGNCLRDLNMNCEAIAAYRESIKYHTDYFDPQISIVGILYDMGLKKLSDLSLMKLFNHYGVDKKQILNQIISREVENACNENRKINQCLDIVIEYSEKLKSSQDKSAPNYWYILSQVCCSKEKIDEAEKYYNKGVLLSKNIIEAETNEDIKKKVREIYTIASWNFSCQLLKRGRMALGWKLFDHGLNTPAEGAQKWQRALFKPFSSKKVNPWRGEDLSNKSILLLGEQGIGDTMAFMTLINPIIKQAKTVYIVVPERLHAIYKRSLVNCTIYSDKEVREKPLNENLFDYQCALGSVPQYLYKDLNSFKSRSFQIQANKKNAKNLRDQYQQNDDRKIIGISWQGGGRKDRIKDKSIELRHLLITLKKYNVRIVSLQYGDDNKIVKEAAAKFGVDFIDDENIDATKNMDSWLDQVEACDGVVSIANTTIHGAGSLKKPTLCLLGRKSDWRWLSDKSEKFSYWYPSVEIAWQDDESKDWAPALAKIDPWIEQITGVR